MNLLLLHGFLGGPSTWDAVASALGARPMRRVVLPGHGMPPEPATRSFDETVARIASSIDAPAIVAGYSMGARIALALALRHPERVAGAVLVGVNPGLQDEGEREARRAWEEAQARAVLDAGLPAFVERWEAQPLFATQRRLSPEMRGAERERRLSHTPAGIASALRTLGLGSQPSLWSALPDCPVPLTFLAGALDEKFAALAVRAAGLAPRAVARAVAGAGHNLALEAPAVVAAALETLSESRSHQETRP